MIDLPGVTLVSVTGVNVDAAQRAMICSMEQIRFAAAVLIASEKPSAHDDRIEWRQIGPMTIGDYSRFILKDLHLHIETPNVLIVQADGFVLNPGLWDPTWLAFDYIGAPWSPTIHAGQHNIRLVNRVGNGGFSLRSKRLLELTSQVNFASIKFPTKAEDVVTCHLLFEYLTARGISYADVAAAARFSVEHPQSETHSIKTAFGFHGQHHAEAIHT